MAHGRISRVWLAGLTLVILSVEGPFYSIGALTRADCQGPGTVCAEYDAAGMVFLARVLQVIPDADDRPLGPVRPQTVTFDVIEDFKGTAGAGTTLTFDPAAAGARVFSTDATVPEPSSRRRSRPATFCFPG